MSTPAILNLEETLAKALGDEEFFFLPKGITRYDYNSMHGWWVRIRRDGAPFQKFFHDSQFLSFGEGLKAAIIYHQEILEAFPLEKTKRANPRALPLSPEERIDRKIAKGKASPYIFWEAKWYDENHKVKKASFSVTKFGEEHARTLALQAASTNHNKTPKLAKVADPYHKAAFKKLRKSDVEFLAGINTGSHKHGESESVEIPEYPEAYEGGKEMVLHLSIERDRKLRNAKVSEFKAINGAIYCEVCSFDFATEYPFLGKELIEVHHIIPLASLTEATTVRLEDLMLLCANCHFVVHQGDAEENLINAMDYFEETRK